MNLQELMGENYKEGLTVDEINTFLSSKKLADLSTGAYVSKDKSEADITALKKVLKEKEDLLTNKLTDEEKQTQTQAEREKEYEALKKQLAIMQLEKNQSKILGLSSEGRVLAGIDEKEFNDFVTMIASENSENVDKIGASISKMLKDAYEKGKSEQTKKGLGKDGKLDSGSLGDNQEQMINRIKELASTNKADNSDHYFK